MQKEKLKHILFLSAWFPNRITPFDGDFVQRHAKLMSENYKVSVLFALGDKTTKEIELVVNEFKNYKEYIYYYPKSTFRVINIYRKMRCLLKGFNKINTVDLVHANVVDFYFLFAIYLATIKKLPLVLTEHWTGYYQKVSFAKKMIAKLAGKLSTFIFPVSNHLMQAMKANGIEGNYKVVPNVIETGLFFPTEKKQNKIPRFLHISMLKEDHKNISGQLNVAKKLALAGFLFEFHIGGNGDNKFIKTFVEENNLQSTIKTFGSLSHVEVAKMMQQADCFVLFSNYETQSIVCLEAFACGIPVIATRVGGLTENFQGNYGILIEKGKEEQLEQAMIRIIEGEQFATKKELFDFVTKNYSRQAVKQKFSAYYQLAIK